MRFPFSSNRYFVSARHRTLHVFLIAAAIALFVLLLVFNLAHYRLIRSDAPKYAAHILIAVDAAAVLIVACSVHLLLTHKRSAR